MARERDDALPEGYEFEGFRIERVLGAGGFGITYLATELAFGRRVAIKEYLPSNLATRVERTTVRPLGDSVRDSFEYGLASFREEGLTLAVFRHQNIVPIHRFLEANGTAYLAMGYVEGDSLHALLKRHGSLSESEIHEVAGPILDGLERVHRTGFLHRDIKPANIVIDHEGEPVLIDFGAARQALGDRTMTHTAIVTPGYSPPEQYGSRGRHGPASDIYAVAATLYACITGGPPPVAPDRMLGEDMTPAVESTSGGYSRALLAAIDAGLILDADKRPQSAEAFRALLSDESAAVAAAAVGDGDATQSPAGGAAAESAARTRAAKTERTSKPRSKGQDRSPASAGKRHGMLGWAIGGAVALAAAIAVAALVEPWGDPERQPAEDAEAEGAEVPGLVDDEPAGTAEVEPAPPPEDEPSADEEEGAPPEEEATSPEVEAPPPEEEATPPQEDAVPPEEEASTPEDEAAVPEEEAAPEDESAQPEEEASLPPTVNRPPVAVDDAAETVAGEAVDIHVLANDMDPDGDPLRIVSTDPSTSDIRVVSAGGASFVTYLPPRDAVGETRIAYTIVDGEGGRAEATVTVTVLPAGPTPAEIERGLGLARADRVDIQRALNEQGYGAGTPDGAFGPSTRAAIRRYQTVRDAEATGYLTRAQAEALIAAAPEPQPEPDPEPAPEVAEQPNETASSEPAPEPEQEASADPVRELVEGKQILAWRRSEELGMYHDSYTLRLAPDGTIEGTVTSEVRSDADTGRWWSEGGKLCIEWSRWDRGATNCYEIDEGGASGSYVGHGPSGTILAREFTVQ